MTAPLDALREALADLDCARDESYQIGSSIDIAAHALERTTEEPDGD